jgi:5-methylcytosine-specific restriction endonuclease McrA
MSINYKDYSPDWKDIIRPDILRRDKYTCQHCMFKRNTYYVILKGSKVLVDTQFDKNYYLSMGIKVIKVILHVAHLNHNIQDNNYSNLLTLCSACHLKYDGKRHAVTRMLHK